MRYSRFKKQMEGAGNIDNGGQLSSRKAKAGKKALSTHRKIKKSPRTVKSEAGESGYGIRDRIPEAAGYGTQNPCISVVKREPKVNAVSSQDGYLEKEA
jgi:hypothetical protein